MALTAKQQRFVQEYLQDLNATQAAICAGYSKKTAAEQGYQLLQKTSVAEAIATAQKERSGRTKIEADDVVRGLHAEATRIGDGASHSARVSAWTALGKHLGMFVDRHEHSGKSDEPVKLVIERRIISPNGDVRVDTNGAP